MASLLSWAGNVAQGVGRQISPFDHGATYNNPHPQPQAPQVPVHNLGQQTSAGHVLTHNPVTNFVGSNIVKPLGQFPIDASNQLYNHLVAPVIHTPQMTPQQVQPIADLAKRVGATGSLHQTVGSGIQTALTIGSGGLASVAEKGATAGVGFAAPKLTAQAIGAARLGLPAAVAPTALKAGIKYGTGALAGGAINSGFGAASAAGAGAKPKDIIKSGAVSGAIGVPLGVAAPVVADVAKPVIKAGVRAFDNRAPLNQAGYLKVGYPKASDLPQDVQDHIAASKNTFSRGTDPAAAIKANKLTPRDREAAMRNGGVTPFSQTDIKTLAKTIPEFGKNPVMTFNPKGQLQSNLFNKDMKSVPTLEFKGGGHHIKINAENYFPMGTDLSKYKAGEQVDMSPALAAGANKIPSIIESKPGVKLPGSKPTIPKVNAPPATPKLATQPNVSATKALPAKSSVGNVTTIHGHTPEDLIGMAQQQKDEFLNHTQAIAAQHGGQVTDKALGNAVKTDTQRINQKITERYGHAPTDILRTQIIHPNPAEAHQAIIDAYKGAGYDVYNHHVTGQPDITNRYAEPGVGYKDVAFKLVKQGPAPDHVVKEVQVISPEMAAAKSAQQGHALYKVARNAATQNPARIQNIMKGIYGRALSAETKRLNSDSVTSLPSDIKSISGTSAPVASDTARALSLPERSSLKGAPSSSKNLGSAATSSGVESNVPNRFISPQSIDQNAGNVNPPIGVSPADIPNPIGKERGFVTSVREKGNYSPEVKNTIQGNYVPQTHADWQAFAKQAASGDLTKVTENAHNILDHPLAPGQEGQMVTAISEIARRHDLAGNTQTATDLLQRLAEKGTGMGQGINAFSLALKREPVGLLADAKKTLTKGGVEITPKIEDKLNEMHDNLKAAPPDSYDRELAIRELHHYVNDQLPRSKMDAGVGIWRAGLLTGPETATKVAFSHAITLPFETAAQIPTALADRAMSLFTGQRATSATLRGAGSGVVQGAKDFGHKMKTGVDRPGSGGFLSDFGSATHQTAYEKFVGNLHGGLFKPAYEGRFKVSLNDQALTEARNQGLRGAEKQQFIRDFVANPSAKAKETAAFDAARATNQQESDLGKMAQSLQHITMGGFPIGRILAPFTRIPSAIGTVGMVDYTPFGVAREVAGQIKAGRFDQRLMSQALGRSATGTATAGLGAALMLHGRMTLKAPSDKKDRALWNIEGKQPNSIYVGGKVSKQSDGTFKYSGGHWMSLNAGGAIGIVLGVGGAFGRAMEQSKGDVVKAVPEALASGSRLLLDQPYFKGASGALNALNDPTRYAQTFLDNTVGSVIPAAVQQTARGTDPNQRSYPANIPDTLKAGIPGQRESLPAQQDLYGHNLPGPGGSPLKDINGVLNPFYPQAARSQDDPVTQELQRLYNNLGSGTSPNIAQPTKNLTINGQKLAMTPQQLHDYIAGSGPVVHDAISNLLSNPQYQQLGDDQKANAINTVITAARTGQKVGQFGDNPKSLSYQDRLAISDPSKLGTVLAAKTGGDPAQTYQQNLLKYQQQVANGQLTPVQQFEAQASLAKQAITSQFSNDTSSLYGLSKAKIASYLDSHPTTAAKTYADLQSLDQQLYNAGINNTLKFAKGLSTSTRGGAKKPKALKLAKTKAPKAYKVYQAKGPRVAKLKAPSFRTSRPKYPSLAIKTPRLARKALA